MLQETTSCCVCLTIFHWQISGCFLRRFTIKFMVDTLWWTAMKPLWEFVKRVIPSQMPSQLIEMAPTCLSCVIWLCPRRSRKKHAYRFRSALNATGLYAALHFFGSLSFSGQSKQGLFSSFQCVGGLVNKNLTMAQKKLLLWHWKLGIGMQRLQAMMRSHTFEDPFGRSQVHPPIIQAKFASTSSCAIPRCQPCELACAQVRSPKVKKFQSDLDSEGAISCNK